MLELYSALVKAQGQIKGAIKDSKNPHFKSSYADLESVINCIREPLASNGLAFIQHVADNVIYTTIVHSSGQSYVSSLPIFGSFPDMQKFGAALTYARRQSLCATFGIPQVDDDGNEAAAAPRAQAQQPVKKVYEPMGKDVEKYGLDTPKYPLFVEGVHNQEVLDICKKLVLVDQLREKAVECKRYLAGTRQETTLKEAVINFFEAEKTK